MPEPTISYFGYGSLVNLDSLRTPYLTAHRARLTGWRRIWLARPAVAGSFAPVENLAFLSVEPCEGSVIDGLIITDHRSSLPSLDEREALYDRVELSENSLEFLDDRPETVSDSFLYMAQQPPAGEGAQILRSYLDVVMQGYRHHFGDDGLERFISTTANFNLPIMEDRDQPIYPRAVALTHDELETFGGMFLR